MSSVFRDNKVHDVVDVMPVPAQAAGASADSGLALWNPTAIGWWSLLLLPVCPWLTRANWKALGEERRAKWSLYFVIAIYALLAILMFMDLKANPAWGIWGGWFGLDGWAQIQYLKSHGITGYRRKSFVKPLITGAGAFVAVLIVLGLISVGFEGMSNQP